MNSLVNEGLTKLESLAGPIAIAMLQGDILSTPPPKQDPAKADEDYRTHIAAHAVRMAEAILDECGARGLRAQQEKDQE